MFAFLCDWAIILLSLLYIHYGTSIIHIKINMSTSFLELSRKKAYVREGWISTNDYSDIAVRVQKWLSGISDS